MKKLIIGAGVSGRSAATFLMKRKDDVYIFDDDRSKLDQLQELNLTKFTSIEEIVPIIEEISEIIISPGVPLSHPLIKTAHGFNISIKSEIDLALSDFRGKIIAITGTNGKSTVTDMVNHILQASGTHSCAAGNIGVPLTSVDLTKTEVLALEVSSYQAETSFQIKPDVAVFTTFSNDHMDRHKTIRNYFLAKWNLFLQQNERQISILPKNIYNFSLETNSPKLTSQIKLIVQEKIPRELDFLSCCNSIHNKYNAHLSVYATFLLFQKKISYEQLAKYLINYKTLKHRFEKIGTINDKIVINDSKSTNIESTTIALENMNDSTILLLGGLDKKSDFSSLRRFSNKIQLIIIFGKSYKNINNQLSDFFVTHCFPTLQEASNFLVKNLLNLRCNILFSPACASYDEFSNFEARGEFFCERLEPFLD